MQTKQFALLFENIPLPYSLCKMPKFLAILNSYV